MMKCELIKKYKNSVVALMGWILILINFQVSAQNRPIISGIDKTTGTVNEEVTISGLNLPTGGDLVVRFGGALVPAGQIVSSTSELLVVTVPTGATYGPISVTNTSTGLTGFSTQSFLLSYGGTTFSAAAATLGAQQQFPPDALSKNTQPFDLTVADFDGDGMLDVAKTNDDDLVIDLYRNTSADAQDAAINFARTELSPPGPVQTRNVDSGDLDGDGLPDLVVSRGSNGDRIIIFRNISTVGDIQFAGGTSIILPFIGENFRIARRPKIADLDGDGKSEIIISNETDNTIYIYRNESNVGAISFNTSQIELTATGVTVGISGLDVKDLNGDGFPDIVANPFISSANIFVFRNIGGPGTISFDDALVVTAPAGLVNSVIGDFDGDGLSDVASSSVTDNAILVFRNTTTAQGGPISLAEPITFDTNTSVPLGIGLGDLNGDGKLDMAVGHEQTTDPRLVVMINGSTGTDIAFTNVNVSASNTSRNVKVADFNNDGRPDIAFTNNVTTDADGDLSLFRNLNCITPVVDPTGPILICTGASQLLETTISKNMTYQWVETGGPTNVGTDDPTYDATTSGDYQVTVSDGNACSVASNVVNISIDPAPNPPAPDIIGNSTVCVGTDFQLTTSTVAQGYQWSGPSDFTSTEQNPTITGINPEQAGTYTLRVAVAPNGCLSDESTTVITLQNVPEPSVINTNGENFCNGNTVTLSTPDFTGLGVTYSWNNGGTAIAGATSTSLAVTTTGTYSVVVSDGTCSLESGSDALTAVSAPASSFTSVDAICVNLTTPFEATSTGTSGFNLNYSWSFNGATTDTTSFAFGTAGNVDAILTTAYDEVDNCASTATRTIDVQAVPNIAVTVIGVDDTELTAPFEKCPSDTVTFSVPTDLLGPAWFSVGATDTLGSESTFRTAAAGSYAFAGTNSVGCIINSQVDLANFEGSGLTLTSSATITDDIIELQDGQEEVDLTVMGGTGYMWIPVEIVSDSTGSMITVTPFDTETLLSVTGTDINDCVETASVTIRDPFVTPRNTFSPNGDGLGDECWEITNTNALNGCTVVIFDSRGRRLLEATSPFVEDCVWDGNFSGNPVPEGVYYFAMSCDDNQFNRSGSILLAR